MVFRVRHIDRRGRERTYSFHSKKEVRDFMDKISRTSTNFSIKVWETEF